MQVPLEVMIVAASSALGERVRVCLLTEPDLFAPLPLGAARPAARQTGSAAGEALAAPPHVLLLAPRKVSELSAWLPEMRQRFPNVPCLVWAKRCLSGLFLTELERHPCTLVATHWSPRDLLFALLDGIRGPESHRVLGRKASPRPRNTRQSPDRSARRPAGIGGVQWRLYDVCETQGGRFGIMAILAPRRGTLPVE
jgi:hypothetical protein